MLKLLGSRTISKQESFDLLLGTPMVSLSHNFYYINLNKDTYRKIGLDTTMENEGKESNKTHEHLDAEKN